ncbi:MAG: hypothetical protein ABSA91_07395 [Acidimicrobiales bacterium]
MPGYHATRPRSRSKRRRRPAIVYFAALTGLALLFFVAGPSTTATRTTATARSAGAAAVPSASLSEMSAPPGSRTTASGSGFKPGSTVRMEIGTLPTSGSVALAVNAAGDINATVHVPAGSRPGWDDVVLKGVAPDGQAIVEELALQVTKKMTS